MRTTLRTLALLLCLLAAVPASARQPGVPPFDRTAPPGEPPAVPGVEAPPPLEQGEVQPRGPIHEAFAAPADKGLLPGPLAPKQPPEPLPEMPPDQKPEGDNVVWVPGYWWWDADRSDFLWVSGSWRVAPPSRKWVPGYWTNTDSGWQWVNGFWAAASQANVPYLAEGPPATLDRGPTIPAPGADYLYAPGTWLYRSDAYVWSPGFWYRAQPRYVFYPARWSWTPGGYVFVNAYWDYPLGNRGVLFAPVYFSRPWWRRPGWFYRPTYAVSLPVVLSSFWVGPGYYTFGDYYSSRYVRLGYQPWLTYGPRYRDPLYGYYNWASPTLVRTLRTTYTGRVRGDLPLPPRTLTAQQRLPASLQVVQPLSRYRSERLRLTRVTAGDRAARERYASALRQASVARRTLETRALARGTTRQALALNRVPAPPAVRATPRRELRSVPRPAYSPYGAPRPATPGTIRRPTNPSVLPRSAPRYTPYPPPPPRMSPAPRSSPRPRSTPPPSTPAPKRKTPPTHPKTPH